MLLILVCGTIQNILDAGVGAVFIVLFVSIISYLIYQKRKLVKLKEKFFRLYEKSCAEIWI